MTEPAAYADRTIAAYRWRAREAVRNWRRFRKPSRLLRRFAAAVRPGGRVLDYGCGIGTDMIFLKRRGFRVEGLDGTLEFIAEARRRCPGAELRHARFERARLPEAAYDAVWCNAALIHVPPAELSAQLEKLARALKPGGVLGITLAWGAAKRFSRTDWIPGRYIAGYRKREAEAAFRGWSVRELKVVSRDGRAGRWIQVLASPPDARS